MNKLMRLGVLVCVMSSTSFLLSSERISFEIGEHPALARRQVEFPEPSQEESEALMKYYSLAKSRIFSDQQAQQFIENKSLTEAERDFIKRFYARRAQALTTSPRVERYNDLLRLLSEIERVRMVAQYEANKVAAQMQADYDARNSARRAKDELHDEEVRYFRIRADQEGYTYPDKTTAEQLEQAIQEATQRRVNEVYELARRNGYSVDSRAEAEDFDRFYR